MPRIPQIGIGDYVLTATSRQTLSGKYQLSRSADPRWPGGGATQLTDVDAAPVVGTRLGRYLFLRELATGAFGPLYELRSEEEACGLSGLGRVVNLAPELEPEAEEAIVASAWDSLELRHEYALCVADVVFGKGWVTLVHDYAEGSLLQSLLARARERSSRFPMAVALRIVSDVIEGLEQHRRVCESSGIAWTPGGTNVSSLLLCGDGRTRSLDGQLVITLLRTARKHPLSEALFCAPEVASAEAQVDERTDVFAAGAVLWQLLTGLDLSTAKDRSASPHVRKPVPKLNLAMSEDAAKLPAGLARAVDSALESDAAKRPATLGAFKSALSHVEMASYAQVIDFTDALLHRESTLFRLTLDPAPKLSDELRTNKTVAAHHDWALELAKKARLPADVPRPALKSPAKPAPAVTPRMKAPALSFAAARTELTGQPRKIGATPLHQPTQQATAKSAHRTLLGITPTAATGHLATHIAAAAPVRVELQPETTPAAISEVQPIVPSEITAPDVVAFALESTSHTQPAVDPTRSEVVTEPASQVTTPQPARATLPAEAPPSRVPPKTIERQTDQHTASTSARDSVDDTFIRRRAIVQLTPLAVAAWSLIMIGLAALATLGVQRLFTSPLLAPLPSVNPSAIAVPTAAPPPSVAPAESVNPRGANEAESHAVPVPTSNSTVSTTESAAAALAPTQPGLAAPSARAAASAAPGVPKPHARTKKHRYIPRGL